jgi:hypothetical protein
MSTRAAICLCAVMALAHADGELDQHLQAGIFFFSQHRTKAPSGTLVLSTRQKNSAFERFS